MTLHELIWDRLVHQVGGFEALVEDPPHLPGVEDSLHPPFMGT